MTTHEPASAALPETSFGFRTRVDFFRACIDEAGLQPTRTTSIIDVGCGTGELVALPLARAGYSVLGVDLHEPSLAAARAAAGDTGAQFRTIDVAELAQQGARFDVVICSEVLEHLGDPLAMLRLMTALLTPRGVCLVSVPAGYGAYELAVRMQRVWVGTPLSTIYRHTLKPLLRRAAAPVAPIVVHAQDAQALGGTMNFESGHVQFFTWRGLHEVFHRAGLRVMRHRGRTMLCGPFLSRWVDRAPHRVEWNARVAGLLPTRLAAGWMFCLGRNDRVVT